MLDDQNYLLSDLIWPDDAGRPHAVMIGAGAQILTYSPTPEQIEAQL